MNENGTVRTTHGESAGMYARNKKGIHARPLHVCVTIRHTPLLLQVHSILRLSFRKLDMFELSADIVAGERGRVLGLHIIIDVIGKPVDGLKREIRCDMAEER